MWQLGLPLLGFAVRKLAQHVAGPQHSRSGYTIVDQGRHTHYRWCAVPKHQASAFLAAQPDATTSKRFLMAVRDQLSSNPAAGPHLAPITEQVIAANHEYPHCQVFVIFEDIDD